MAERIVQLFTPALPADVLRDDAEEWGKALPGGGAGQSRGT
jgi:hypothetical protein